MSARITKASAMVVAALTAVSTPSVARATSDTTPPVLHAPHNAQFSVGTVLSPMALDADDQPQATGEIIMHARWSASDASGICGYSIRPEWAGDVGKWSPWNSVNSVTTSTTDYNDQFGGGSFKFMGYGVRARDCASNITHAFVRFMPIVSQEDGATFGGYEYGGVTAPTYKGRWTTATCDCSSGGRTRRTRQARAAVTFVANSDHVGLVMPKGPTRGKAKVYVNGTLKAVVNTHAATNVHRAVVWSGPGGRVRVVNLATRGHPRIDLDAVLTNSSGHFPGFL